MFQSNDNSSRQRKGMWQKLKEKKAVEREHESNFKAGRIPIHERNLHRTGIRGRKRYIYYAFLYLLGILCFINLVVRYFTYRNTKMY
jgi:beta-sarcoglycan